MLGKFINHCEDSLSASVFSHLLHLPAEVFWALLRKACYSNDLPESAGEPLVVEMWPKWNATETGNSKYVEPDVFIRFADFDLIIEAKRWDDGQQDPAQWKRELVAYANEYGEVPMPVRMIALGGIHHEHDEVLRIKRPILKDGVLQPDIICSVHMCRWRGILYQSKRMLKELEKLEYPTSQTAATRRVLEDLIDLFAWHSYSTRPWFADADFVPFALSAETERHQRLFQKISATFANP